MLSRKFHRIITDSSYPTEPLVFQENHPVFSEKHDPMVTTKVKCVPWSQKVSKCGFTLGFGHVIPEQSAFVCRKS